MCRYGQGPLFFGAVDLLVEGGSEGVTKELTALVEKKGLTSINDGASGRVVCCLFQFLGHLQGHLDNLALQRRLGI